MKRFIIVTAICCLLSACVISVQSGGAAIASETEKNSEVTHFFTHALIADPELAFEENNTMREAYNDDCITAKEFRAILTSLYEKNYMLVDIHRVYNKGKKVMFNFPSGKKPMILSFDDINYYTKKMHLGMNDKLVVSNGKIASVRDGKTEFDNEVVTVLERFIEDHPDFSYEGARGMLCLTGFDGILGYRTNAGSSTRAAEIEVVRPVVAALKKSGWRFACHSYGHYHMTKLTDERFARDTAKWKKEVEPLVGATDIYVYPYGEHVIVGNKGKIAPKHRSLQAEGFTLYCGVGLSSYFRYYPKSGQNALVMDRIPLDGRTLRAKKSQLKKYFDYSNVYDYEARAPMSRK